MDGFLVTIGYLFIVDVYERGLLIGVGFIFVVVESFLVVYFEHFLLVCFLAVEFGVLSLIYVFAAYF